MTTASVNVAGFLRGTLGLGEAARLYVAALQAAGVPVTTTSVEVLLPELTGASGEVVKRSAEFNDVRSAVDPSVNLICVNAPELPQFYLDVGPLFFEGKRSIGVWAWEVDRVPPEWAWAYGVVDEIWCYSRYVADILRAESPVPVLTVPLPVLRPAPNMPPPDLGLPDRFTFMFLFDFYSTLQRKNPLGLIEAFKRAFKPDEGPQLLLKSFNGDYKPERLARLQEAAAEHPDVHLVDRYLSAAERDALMAACDCYVSLHRAEGFGLTLAEAMALGKPVIATGFSGNTDFMTPENSHLVRYTRTAVGPEGENYPADGTWAEPDLEHAAQLMRRVWEDRSDARARAERGRAEVLEKLSTESVGALARGRVEQAASLPPRNEAVPPPPALEAWRPLRQAQWKLDFDPLADARAQGGPRGLVREGALRAMRPFTYHQEELNEALFRGLRDLAERVDLLTHETLLDAHGRAHLRRMILGARARPSPGHPAISLRDEQGRAVLGFDTAGEASDAPYADFEAVFRGDEDLIRERQRDYLELLHGRDWVLDLGCGRGEFLELLRESGLAGRGVDSDAGMVRVSRSKGLKVEHADALDHLRACADASVPAIFAAQFVEHLPPAVLDELLALLVEKLAPDGVAILETVNPHSPSALKAFWVDPTHHHPLFPEVLLALCRFAGFASGRVVFPGGTGDFELDIHSSPDYAVVARKTRS